MHRDRAFTQQVTVKRGNEHPLEYRFKGCILDQQVGLQIFDRLQNVQQRMGGEDGFDRYLQPQVAEPIELFGLPAAVAMQIALLLCIVDLFLP
ncbi:hypothetical protein D3C87_1377520 [compost metagenome]